MIGRGAWGVADRIGRHAHAPRSPPSRHHPTMKLLFILLVGIAIGYGYGFSDAQTHDKNIVSRLVDRAGGSHRDRYTNDIDARMDKATR